MSIRLLFALAVLISSFGGMTGRITATAMESGAIVCGGEFEPIADASLSESEPTTPQGGGATLRLSQGARGEARIVLRFDLGSAVPPSATIYAATLALPVENAGSSAAYTIEVRGVISAWSEATVTWANAPSATAQIHTSVVSPGLSTAEADATALVNLWTTGVLTETSVLLAALGDDVDQTYYSREAVGGAAALPKPKLVVRCAVPVERPAVSREAGDAMQARGLSVLRAASGASTEMRVVNGALRTAVLNMTAPSSAGTDNVARARWLFSTHAGAFRLANPATDLQLRRRSRSDDFLAFRQMHEGVPVYASHVGVNFRGPTIVGVLGRYAPLIDAPSTPRLTAAQAERIARATSEDGTPRRTNAPATMGRTELTWFAPQLLGVDDANVYLTWQVFLNDGRSVLIDADSGVLRYQRAARYEGFDLQLDSMEGTEMHGNVLCGGGVLEWYTENGKVPGASPDQDGQIAYAAIRKVDTFWRKAPFWRDSYDDDGTQFELFVNTDDGEGDPGWTNAHYNPNCELFEFGAGIVSEDIVAHEVTHAVVEETADLEYFAESGALNESLADVFAQFIDSEDWLLGEDLMVVGMPDEEVPGCDQVRAARSMSNPPCYGDPDHYSDRAYKNPGDWCDNDQNDDCGVHTNNGILNKAAYLLIEGGLHRGRIVNGIGAAKAKKIYYWTTTSCLGPSSDFADARYCAVMYAQTLGSSTVCSVRNAYAAVGVGGGDVDCDGLLDSSDGDNDDDGVPDSEDNCPNGANPSQTDIDGNGDGDVLPCDADADDDQVSNDVDNCPLADNTGQSDMDQDGLGNPCDDTDGDNYVDDKDNCPWVANADQKNADGDGLGDVCDPNGDNDGWINEYDNCPYVANDDQKNTDVRDGGGDQYGDACDSCALVKNAFQVDTDADGKGNECDGDDDDDGVLDRADNCPLDGNPDQADLDGDGLGWPCDEATQLLNPPGALQGTAFAVPQIRMPFWSCPQCTGELPANYRTVVNVTTPAGYRARVVDASGRQAAKGAAAGGVQQLTFTPKSHEYGAPFAARGADISTVDAPYTLVIEAPAGADPTEMVSLTVTLSETIKPYVSTEVYVPAVVR